jgi:4-amino-4-deoxy-L-arabinose transferase-like glycosyltransferase
MTTPQQTYRRSGRGSYFMLYRMGNGGCMQVIGALALGALLGLIALLSYGARAFVILGIPGLTLLLCVATWQSFRRKHYGECIIALTILAAFQYLCWAYVIFQVFPSF